MPDSLRRRYPPPFQICIGILVGVCVAVPPLLRLEEQGWTGINIFFFVAGSVITAVWVVLAVLRLRATRQESEESFTGSAPKPGGPQG